MSPDAARARGADDHYPFASHRSVAEIDTGRCGLTPRAAELLAYLRARETTPSFAEMGAAIGVASKHSVFRLVAQLIDRGAVTVSRYPGGKIKRHSLRVVDKRVNLGSVATPDLLIELERRGIRWPVAA